jgi:hypothetical protein
VTLIEGIGGSPPLRFNSCHVEFIVAASKDITGIDVNEEISN